MMLPRYHDRTAAVTVRRYPLRDRVDPPKRRLPLLQSNPDPAGEAPPRRPWQWIGFGALAVFTAWIPLASLGLLAAAAFGRRVSPVEVSPQVTPAGEVGAAVILAGALALGAALGGVLVGKWGPSGVGV